mmetsp:Transcript_29528/g.39288  ORF Transcript_29528/g.39288 Transcript_29528/m.39288 type:complete len:85 (-) Transcript_29528:178-432(-)
MFTFRANQRAAVSLTQTLARANFSAASGKEALFSELVSEASQINDYNFRSYFVRRATEDQAHADSFSEDEIRERLEQMKRIRAV